MFILRRLIIKQLIIIPPPTTVINFVATENTVVCVVQVTVSQRNILQLISVSWKRRDQSNRTGRADRSICSNDFPAGSWLFRASAPSVERQLSNALPPPGQQGFVRNRGNLCLRQITPTTPPQRGGEGPAFHLTKSHSLRLHALRRLTRCAAPSCSRSIQTTQVAL